MAIVDPEEVKRLFATMRAASSRRLAKAKLSLEGVIQIGEDGDARRNHRLTKIMQLSPEDRRKAMYALLRDDTPFCPPGGRLRELLPWNPFDGLPGSLQAAFHRAPLHALMVSRPYITQSEATFTFPHRMVWPCKLLANGSNPGQPKTSPPSGRGPVKC